MNEPRPLSGRDAETLAATVANLAAARLPLVAGLRAAADESTGRLSSGLRRLSDELERGQTLEQAFEAGSGTPAEFSKLMREDAARWRKVIQDAGLKPDA